ncbi:ABC transporter substrate-binding protein [Aquincola sp. S2]|uniref:ABC transporter substrate-binding protein n=1 Tax=Pseudaquabacterium terrae TaxID=2732868 RepID=A0ABX2EBT1_9BURK|nr:ABC transporter substrate-binding protein [Aquabacterium terrae]NRF65802.1 ABC transporter substrate-binding protein [Aquabacterium terrae]
MRRRTVIVGGLLARPLEGMAQPAGKMARIGFIGGSTPDPVVLSTWVEPLRQGLRDLGYVEGRNITIEFRWHEGKQERLPGLLAELIALAPDVLVTLGPPSAILARDATPTVPVVALAIDDPVATGLAVTHARPGRNITGLSGAFQGILEKRLQLMKDIVPDARRFAVLTNPISYGRAQVEAYLQRQNVERLLAVQVKVLEVRGPDDFDAAFATMARERVDAVAVLSDSMFWVHRTRLGELCIKHRLPSVWGGAGYLDAGGLLSYQGDFAETARRAASFIDKILKGTKPGDIPFEQATKLELVVNLKVAKTLGLTLPQSVLVRADQVIE